MCLFEDSPRRRCAVEAEPLPLVPARSEPLCVRSGFHPLQGPQKVLQHSSACFGPDEQNLSRSVRAPAAQARDWSPPPPTERSVSVSRLSWDPAAAEEDSSPRGATAPSEVHKAVWLADRPHITELARAGADVNEVDAHGSTPLMLAVQLLPRAQEYRDVIRHLLDHDADPRIRSSLGWSPFDEAVSAGDKQLVCVLFEGAQRHLKQRWHSRLSSLALSLTMLPDFECCIRWEFESPVLPWLNKLAPSDVVRLRKRGTSLRLDSTLASWKRFRLCKRRDFTTLFRGDRLGEAAGGGERSGSSEPCACMVNHSKKTAVDVTEGLDPDEVRAVVDDLVAADVMQWDMQMDDLEVAEATTWLGALAGPADVNGWRARRFDVRGTLGLAVRKKGQRNNGMTFQEYFGCPLPADACLPELRAEFSALTASPELAREPSRISAWSESTECIGADGFSFGGEALPDMEAMSTTSEVLGAWPDAQPARGPEQDELSFGAPQRGLLRDERTPRSASSWLGQPKQPSMRKSSSMTSDDAKGRRKSGKLATNDKVGKTSKSVSASVWLATDFPISLQQFLPILEALSLEHEAMKRLKDVLSSDTFMRAARSAKQATGGDASEGGHVFPVRASIPLNLAVRAIVHFEAFQLQPPGTLPAKLFEVPEGYKFIPRREAQKTPNRARKRMLLANLAL